MTQITFSSLAEFQSRLNKQPGPNSKMQKHAKARNDRLTKPLGALGRLEDLAIWYAGWRGHEAPYIEKPQAIVFAGNHGVVAQGVSAFPQDVTDQMVLNFQNGGAAINQICDTFGIHLAVQALDLEHPTMDFTSGPAMHEEDCVAALQKGWNAVDPDADLLVVGEMGIGNTTSAAAIACALFGEEAENWVGRGTGVSEKGMERKIWSVQKGLQTNPSALKNGLEALRCLGGREIAAMAGAIAGARAQSIPVILDGFICSAAAACLMHVAKNALDHTVAGHVSAEAAHAKLLKHLGKEPILSLDMRLGEGSGAALAVGILKAALACHSGMATFAEAGVSEG